MGLVQDLSTAQIALQIGSGEADRFVVTRYRGQEGLSRLYRFEVDLVARESDVDIDEIIRQKATLSIETPAGPRFFHGIINRFELVGETTDQTYYRAHLVPREWLLTQRYQSRIFQNQTVPGIIFEVLKSAGMDIDRVFLNIEREFQERTYCVQYRETDYNFICRLMEEEGIWWRYEQADDGPFLVLIDDSTKSYPQIPNGELPYAAASGLNLSASEAPDHVSAFRAGRGVSADGVMLADFNFEKSPGKDLFEKHSLGDRPDLPWHDFPGGFGEEKRGGELAAIRAQELAARQTLCSGRSNCPTMACGHVFKLAEHPNAHLNREYLITALIHEGRQSTYRTFEGDAVGSGILTDSTGAPGLAAYWQGQVATDPANTHAANGADPFSPLGLSGLDGADRATGEVNLAMPVYQCRFECVRADVVYRPARITPKPTVRGTQTARVVGPEGEEIYTDKYGRVKVQFHWDTAGGHGPDASCWIRVSQGMAGGAYGMMFLPRVGQEVVVDFLEGDPDQPIIVGRVYNADHMPPYELPQQKTISTIRTCSSPGAKGGNELRFEDAKGKEQLLLFAEKELHVRSKSSRCESIGGSSHLTVAGNKHELVKQNKHAKVRLDQVEEIDGSKHLNVSGDVKEFFSGKQTTYVDKQYNLLNSGGIWLGSDTSITLWCKGNFITLDESGVTIVGKKVKINSGGSASVAMPDAPDLTEEPRQAATIEYGHNKRYDREFDESVPTSHSEDEKQTSWIEIELVDDLGQPVPGEVFEIRPPEGEPIRGSLDAHGLARVQLDAPETCEITFPNLDSAVWERT